MIYERKVQTRLTAQSPKQGTNVTLDFTSCTVEDLAEVAADSIIILMQSRYRRAEVVPPKDSVNVREFLASLKSRATAKPTVESLAAKANSLTPEQRAALIAALSK